VLLEPIDAADQRRFAGPRWSAYDDALAAIDRQVDVAQDVEVAIPFVHAGDVDGRLVRDRGILFDVDIGHGHRLCVVVSRRSMNIE
jgi:hypothetical protein